jgi:hypothetical protein
MRWFVDLALPLAELTFCAKDGSWLCRLLSVNDYAGILLHPVSNDGNHKATPMLDHSSFTRLRLLASCGKWGGIDPLSEAT